MRSSLSAYTFVDGSSFILDLHSDPIHHHHAQLLSLFSSSCADWQVRRAHARFSGRRLIKRRRHGIGPTLDQMFNPLTLASAMSITTSFSLLQDLTVPSYNADSVPFSGSSGSRVVDLLLSLSTAPSYLSTSQSSSSPRRHRVPSWSGSKSNDTKPKKEGSAGPRWSTNASQQTGRRVRSRRRRAPHSSLYCYLALSIPSAWLHPTSPSPNMVQIPGTCLWNAAPRWGYCFPRTHNSCFICRYCQSPAFSLEQTPPFHPFSSYERFFSSLSRVPFYLCPARSFPPVHSPKKKSKARTLFTKNGCNGVPSIRWLPTFGIIGTGRRFQWLLSHAGCAKVYPSFYGLSTFIDDSQIRAYDASKYTSTLPYSWRYSKLHLVASLGVGELTNAVKIKGRWRTYVSELLGKVVKHWNEGFIVACHRTQNIVIIV